METSYILMFLAPFFASSAAKWLEALSRYSSVEVVISLGSNSIDLSKLTITGIAKDKAMQLLKENGLSAELVEENSDTVALDNVIRYEPVTAKKGDTIRLYVSKGKKEELVKVPDFSGRAMKEVQGQLAANVGVSTD